MDNIYAAHIREDGAIQSVHDHLEGTAKLAGKFANEFGCGDYGYLCGLMHDIGKYSKRFQERIRGLPIFADHSTAGAVECNEAFKGFGLLLAYCIAGHHAGLPDGGSKIDTADEPTLYGRLKRTNLPDYGIYKQHIDIKENMPQSHMPIRPVEGIGFSVSFLTRMLYSCLVDSDYLDTEYFMSINKIDRYIEYSFDDLLKRLYLYLEKFKHPINEINAKRNEILRLCINSANKPKGIYTLTVPTGGGKTISSLAFALEHAQKHDMKRIIYVIPYTSIIEQNAAVFKNILGEKYVLEHHSNIVYDDKNEEMSKFRYATENWDMPVVVTTNVQFFESFFANRSSMCRKIHNTANSVIIFDEAQMLPTNFLLPCIRTIHELTNNYGSTCVLCSATQPALEGLFPERTVIYNAIGDTSALYKFFRRARIKYIGQLEDDQIIERMYENKQVLCIVNTRRQAQILYRNLDEHGSFHLSTLMCPMHRSRVLHDIKDNLSKGMVCRVVSTSLIEAGVDIDFPVVFRQMAGLDSQIQAAGRCNREGKNPCETSFVYIFEVSDQYKRHQPDALRRPTEIARAINDRFNDVSSPEAIKEYFLQLYQMEGDGLDNKKIVHKLESGALSGFNFPFAQIASEFKIIDDMTCSVIIPFDDDVKSSVYRLRNQERSKSLIRSLQPYIVNIYKADYDKLFGAGAIEPLDAELSVLIDMDRYSDKTGLDIKVEEGMGVFT